MRKNLLKKGGTVVPPSDSENQRQKTPINTGNVRESSMRTRTARACVEINILIACEESQQECLAFRSLGFNAFSCDVQPCAKRWGRKEYHIMEDVTPYLNGKNVFKTMDGEYHFVEKWHMIIAHPPCTYICKVGAVHMVVDGVVDKQRYAKMIEAVKFFKKCLEAKADFVAVENPLPQARAGLPKPSCFIQPSWFGEKYTKKTLYWLKNLPPLMPTVIYPNPKEFARASRGKYRSRTFPNVAAAIASQWGSYVKENL